MTGFRAMQLPSARDVVATDGSDVRILLGLAGGTMAHFQLSPGHTSSAVTHRTVEEIWYFLSGRGEMWLKQEGREEIVPLESGVCPDDPARHSFPVPLARRPGAGGGQHHDAALARGWRGVCRPRHVGTDCPVRASS